MTTGTCLMKRLTRMGHTAALMLLIAGAAAAQPTVQEEGQQQSRPGQAAAQGGTAQAGGSQELAAQERAAVASQPPPPAGEPTNVRVEVTITDQSGSEKPVAKTMSLIAIHGGTGQIRTEVLVRSPHQSFELPLSIDVAPQILGRDRIRVKLTLEYKTHAKLDQSTTQTSTVKESFSFALDNGKSLRLSESADPASDRKVSVDVKATILR